MSRTVKPEQVKTLRDWAARWPKATNLSFDAETREPTVYSADKERQRVATIPWKREGDTMTIITQPTRFSAQAVEAARSRYAKIQQQKSELTLAATEQLHLAETALLDAWRAYHAAPAASRGVLRRDVLAAERAMREMEEVLASQLYKERALREIKGFSTVYVPPMPTERRGIPIGAVAGSSE